MRTTVTINNSELIQRLDDKKDELCFPTLSDLVSMILRKGLDHIDRHGLQWFVAISPTNKEDNENI